MRVGEIAVKRRVWIGLIFILAVTGGWWVWTRTKGTVQGDAEKPSQPFVRLAGNGSETSNQVLRERTEYFDPTPLFFPTEWNFGQSALRESVRRQPGDIYGGFEAKLTFPDQNINRYNAEATAAPGRLVDVLAQGNEAPFGGIGHVDNLRPALPERSGYIEVKNLSGGQMALEQTLIGLTLPHVDFAPLEFLVAVGSAGIVGEPVIVQWISPDVTGVSDSEEVDAFFRSYIVKTLRLGERLSPGRYRVWIGP